MQQDDRALRLRLLQALYNVHHACRFNTFKVVEVAVAHRVLRSVGLWLLTEVVAHSIGCLVYVRAKFGQRWCKGILGVGHKLLFVVTEALIAMQISRLALEAACDCGRWRSSSCSACCRACSMAGSAGRVLQFSVSFRRLAVRRMIS